MKGKSLNVNNENFTIYTPICLGCPAGYRERKGSYGFSYIFSTILSSILENNAWLWRVKIIKKVYIELHSIFEWSKGFKACGGRMKCGERKKKDGDKEWFQLEISSN